MKIIIISILFLSTVFLSGCSLNNKFSSQAKITTPEKTEAQKKLDDKWDEIKTNKKLLACVQSKKDFDQKKAELLPRYKEVLNKEITSKELSGEDQYIKTIYGWIEAGGKNYSVFEDIINSETSNNEEKIIRTQNLLEFVYCPDVSKIPITYPLTPSGCTELLSAWTPPFEVPEPKNYQITEEYNLALKKFKTDQQGRLNSASKCCHGEITGMGCTKLVSWLKQTKTPVTPTPNPNSSSVTDPAKVSKEVDEFLKKNSSNE